MTSLLPKKGKSPTAKSVDWRRLLTLDMSKKGKKTDDQEVQCMCKAAIYGFLQYYRDVDDGNLAHGT